jgi:hypothetical protein
MPVLRDLVIRSLSGGEPHAIPVPIRQTWLLWWAPDNRSFIIASPSPTLEFPDWRGLYRLDRETGEYARILPAEGIPGWTTLSRAGTEAYFYWWSEGRFSLRTRDLRTGTERELLVLDTLFGGVTVDGRLALSPGGDWLAALLLPTESPNERIVALVSTETGVVQELNRHAYFTEDRPMCGDIVWAPGGGHLLFGDARPASDDCVLSRVPVEGGDAVDVATLPPHDRVAMHPEGNRLVFRHGETRGEIWVLDYGEGGTS